MAVNPTQTTRSQFPLFSYEEFDFAFETGWPIGLKSTYPEELIRRIAAARVSFQLGNSGIDYTYKRYLKDKTYPVDDGSRLDLRVSRFVEEHLELLFELISRTTALEPKREGEIICEWTYLRIPFALKFLLSCANKGALYESVAIARMALEQIAWAVKVDELSEHEAIQNTSATRAVSNLKTLSPGVGPLYGWLSAHAHWMYDGHVKAMAFTEERLTSLFATAEFKRKSLGLTLLMGALAISIYMSAKRNDVTRILGADTQEPSYQPGYSKGESPRPGLPLLRKLADLKGFSDLLSELNACGDADEDLDFFAATMPKPA
jgi:hypothetical protein